VRVAVYVPATDDEMRVRLEFSSVDAGLLTPVSVEGTANEWLALRTLL